MPRVPDNFLDCVFYLYPTEEDARIGRNAGGTGFFIGRKSEVDPSVNYLWAVTNWHVACSGGASVMRVIRKDGTPEIFPYGPEDWFFDPNGHDIAIANTTVNSDTHLSTYIPIDESTTTLHPNLNPIGIGDDVFMIGRFVDHDGGDINRPTVRFGNISMMPTPITQPNGNKRDTYCLDMHSRSGYSGSPVFLFRTPGADLAPRPEVQGHVLLNGGIVLVPLGIHIGQFPEIWKIRGVNTSAVPAESFEVSAIEHHIEGVSGMTCAAPLSAIQELLELPRIKAGIEMAEAIKRQATTPITPEISKPEHPTKPTEGGDQHK